MTPTDFKSSLAASASGSLVWHSGFLARERKPWTERRRSGDVSHPAVPGLDTLAKAVAVAAATGAVSLTQKRIAIRRPPPAARSRLASYGRRNIVLSV